MTPIPRLDESGVDQQAGQVLGVARLEARVGEVNPASRAARARLARPPSRTSSRTRAPNRPSPRSPAGRALRVERRARPCFRPSHAGRRSAGGGPSPAPAGGRVRLTSSGTPSQLGTRVSIDPVHFWTPAGPDEHGIPSALGTSSAAAGLRRRADRRGQGEGERKCRRMSPKRPPTVLLNPASFLHSGHLAGGNLLDRAAGRGGVGRGSYDRPVARSGARHVCRECGHEALTWTGRCPGLRGVEHARRDARARARPRRGGAPRRRVASAGAARPVPLRDVEAPARRAARDRDRRARPRARRRARPRLAGPARRLAGDRQEHGDRDGARQPRGGRARGRSTSPARSRRRRCGCGPSASASARSRSRCSPRPRLERRARGARGGASRGLRRRLGPDAAARARRRGAPGLGRARCARRPRR